MAPKTNEDERMDKLRKCFELFDQDGNGKLDAEELQAILTRQGGGQSLSLADAQEIIADFDENKDGFLQFDEFVKAWNFHLKEEMTMENLQEASIVVSKQKS
jgi:Ca2+-binding EF-hand superfamily protein